MMHDIISLVFLIYTLMLTARILGSWFPQWRDHPIMIFLTRCTDPYLNLFRRFIPPLGAIDISPIIAFFALQLIRNLLLYIF